MNEIIVEFRGRVSLDPEDPAITSFLRDAGLTLDDFLDDSEMVMDHIFTHWDSQDIEIAIDEVDIDYEVTE
ncbi:MAG: hypothetical protein O0X93_01680 [Methanocorpusculum sp.]|nr:hypothetical protein [Methanocorpusculum sp.]MDE2521855.1 hypothetical protein [Methanocorpusculum sp.]MDE2524848.1 hypothetical protein [Methanocorpusculum sp.]